MFLWASEIWESENNLKVRLDQPEFFSLCLLLNRLTFAAFLLHIN